MLRDLDADGFKVDFTHLIPRGGQAAVADAGSAGEALGRAGVANSAGGRWGLELLRQWLASSDAARAAKPDALIITHTANPYLADLVDMLRLERRGRAGRHRGQHRPRHAAPRAHRPRGLAVSG